MLWDASVWVLRTFCGATCPFQVIFAPIGVQNYDVDSGTDHPLHPYPHMHNSIMERIYINKEYEL